MVPATLTAKSFFQFSVTPGATNTGLNPTISDQAYQALTSWSFGTSVAQVNECYMAVRTLAASTAETLDLFGALVGLFGETLNFTSIKAILVSLLTTPTGASSITLGNAASHAWTGPLGGTTPTITITGGDTWMQTRSDATGWAVVDGASDNLKVLNNDASIAAVYLIALLGLE